MGGMEEKHAKERGSMSMKDSRTGGWMGGGERKVSEREEEVRVKSGG